MGLFGHKFDDRNNRDIKETEKSLFSHSHSFQYTFPGVQPKREETEEKHVKDDRKKKNKGQTGGKTGDQMVTRQQSKTKVDYVYEEGGAKRRRVSSENGSRQTENKDDDHEATADKSFARTSPHLSKTKDKDVWDFASKPSASCEHVRPLPEPQICQVSVGDVELLDDDEDSDPEIAILRKAARERKNRQDLENFLRAQSPIVGTDAVSILSKTDEAQVQYMIQSSIEGTKPLIIHRRVSAPLKQLRETWLSKQVNLSAHIKNRIFLTYCMRKVYDSTTGRALGLQVDGDGHVSMAGMEPGDGAARIILEAVTEETLKNMKEAKAAERKGLSESYGVEEDALAGTAEQSEQSEQRVLKLRLRAKRLPEQRLRVKPSTDIVRIEWYLRQQWEIPSQRTLRLEFDGEKLDNNTQIKDTEIMTCEDEACVDVYF